MTEPPQSNTEVRRNGKTTQDKGASTAKKEKETDDANKHRDKTDSKAKKETHDSDTTKARQTAKKNNDKPDSETSGKHKKQKNQRTGPEAKKKPKEISGSDAAVESKPKASVRHAHAKVNRKMRSRRHAKSNASAKTAPTNEAESQKPASDATPNKDAPKKVPPKTEGDLEYTERIGATFRGLKNLFEDLQTVRGWRRLKLMTPTEIDEKRQTVAVRIGRRRVRRCGRIGWTARAARPVVRSFFLTVGRQRKVQDMRVQPLQTVHDMLWEALNFAEPFSKETKPFCTQTCVYVGRATEKTCLEDRHSIVSVCHPGHGGVRVDTTVRLQHERADAVAGGSSNVRMTPIRRRAT